MSLISIQNESRNSEMLAAACAVGVACTFAAPIGGNNNASFVFCQVNEKVRDFEFGETKTPCLL